MQKSGNTPLIRARQLEKQLGIKRIFIKLEGASPTGHMHDRLGEMAVALCKAQGRHQLVVDGETAFMDAICHHAIHQHIKTWLPKRYKPSLSTLDDHTLCETHTIRKGQLETYRQRLLQWASDHQACLIDQQVEGIQLLEHAFANIFVEINQKIKGDIGHLFINHQPGQDRLLTQSMMGRLFDGTISVMPHVHGCIPDHLNQSDNETDDQSKLITSTELKEARSLLRRYEQLAVSTQGARPFAVFLKQHRAGLLDKDNHVIILADGRSLIDIIRLKDESILTKSQIIEYVMTWLEPYADTLKETQDAVNHAFEKGFILLARQNQTEEGICIIVHSGFEDFIPTYHLAYIGTAPSTKGRGVGTELIRRAIDLSHDNLSLHVNLTNRSATRLYQKMGFKHAYNRMIYQGE